MMIYSVSCSDGAGGNVRLQSRTIGGLIANAIRARFPEFDRLPEPSRWEGAPSWRATGPTERTAFRMLGLDPDQPLPLPEIVQAHARNGKIYLALRGDAIEALGADLRRLEEGIEAATRPTLEAVGLGSASFEEVRSEPLMTNERLRYRIPCVYAKTGWEALAGLEDALSRVILASIANSAYGYRDRADRLMALTVFGGGLRIEEHGKPEWVLGGTSGEGFIVPRVVFSMPCRIEGPLFLMDRVGLESDAVALLSHDNNPHLEAA